MNGEDSELSGSSCGAETLTLKDWLAEAVPETSDLTVQYDYIICQTHPEECCISRQLTTSSPIDTSLLSDDDFTRRWRGVAGREYEMGGTGFILTQVFDVTLGPYAKLVRRVAPTRMRTFYQQLLPPEARSGYFLTETIDLTGSTQRRVLEKESGTIATRVSSEVRHEIEKWNLDKEMDTALAIIRVTYRTLDAIEVAVTRDPEIPERKRIRITLIVSGNPEDVFSDELQYKGQLYSTLDIQACELITTTHRWRD